MNPDPPTQASPRANLLLVDDDAHQLDVLTDILEAPTYRCVRANSAEAALKALLQEEFAALVLDVNLPDMSGVELARLIRQRPRDQALPILMLTAYSQDEIATLDGVKIGAVEYLSKPINPDRLRAKIAALAGRVHHPSPLTAPPPSRPKSKSISTPRSSHRLSPPRATSSPLWAMNCAPRSTPSSVSASYCSTAKPDRSSPSRRITSATFSPAPATCSSSLTTWSTWPGSSRADWNFTQKPSPCKPPSRKPPPASRSSPNTITSASTSKSVPGWRP